MSNLRQENRNQLPIRSKLRQRKRQRPQLMLKLLEKKRNQQPMMLRSNGHLADKVSQHYREAKRRLKNNQF